MEIKNRDVRFRVSGLDGSLALADWPKNLPLPNPDWIVIELPNHSHKGIAEDKTGAYHHCVQVLGHKKYEWTLADNVDKQSREVCYS